MSDLQRTILLDVLGTLVRDPFEEAVPAFFGMGMEELLRVKHPTAWVEFERGERTESEFLADFFLDGRPVDGVGLRAAMEGTYAWLPGIESVVAELAARGHGLHALSNYPLWYRWIEARLGLSRYLRWSFVSCHLGLRKPDPAIYRRALSDLGVEPSSVVFVDDRAENCEAAGALGIDAIHFRGASALRDALLARGLLGEA